MDHNEICYKDVKSIEFAEKHVSWYRPWRFL